MGQYAIQLARRSNWKVVATASPHNFDHVKALGALAVFHYRDPDVVTKVKAAAGDTIRVAVDAIGTRDAQATSAAVVRPAGGRVVHTNPVFLDATDRTEVQRDCKQRGLVVPSLSLNMR